MILFPKAVLKHFEQTQLVSCFQNILLHWENNLLSFDAKLALITVKCHGGRRLIENLARVVFVTLETYDISIK